MVLSTHFNLKVSCGTEQAPGIAEVLVSLSAQDSGLTVLMDGLRLGPAPMSTNLPCNSVTGHELSIEVSGEAPAGPFESGLSFALRGIR